MSAETDLAILMAAVHRLIDLGPVITEKLVLDVQMVAIAEAEGDLAGAWAIARPWLAALARVQQYDGSPDA